MRLRSRSLFIGVAAIFAVFSLVGCVSLPVGDHLLLSSESTMGIVGADCTSGWQEVSHGPEEEAALDPAGFDLLTWNVHKAQRDRWGSDFRRISSGRELILLQEAYLTPSFRKALEDSGLRWLMVRAFDYRAAETGVLTAGGVSPAAACLIRTVEPLIRLPKSTLVTRYPLRGTRAELWVANLHGVNFTPGTEQFRFQLESVAEVLAAHEGPLILAGDFNDWNGARHDILREIAAKLGLATLSFSDDRRSRHFGRPVDHLFYRDLQVVHSASVPLDSSDHHPILASFRWPSVSRRASQP